MGDYYTMLYIPGYLIGFSFTRDAHEEVARIKNNKKMEIKLITVQEILDTT
jgi:hypothetical protein